MGQHDRNNIDKMIKKTYFRGIFPCGYKVLNYFTIIPPSVSLCKRLKRNIKLITTWNHVYDFWKKKEKLTVPPNSVWTVQKYIRKQKMRKTLILWPRITTMPVSVNRSQHLLSHFVLGYLYRKPLAGQWKCHELDCQSYVHLLMNLQNNELFLIKLFYSDH